MMDAALCGSFQCLRRTVQKNLAVLTVTFLQVLGAARGGNGRLSLGMLFRVLPTSGTAHAREKRLRRFLENRRLDPRGVTDGLARLIFGRRGNGLWPILFDQTKSEARQALLAGVPFEGRALPLAVYTFDYPWQETGARSQNRLEEVFLLDVESALPAGTRVEHAGRTCKLGELRCGRDRPRRYRGVLYQASLRVPVDIVAFHDPTFQEPWWLVVPPNSEAILPTETVVALYRERMQIEHSFRDFKTHLGLRGLQLQVRVAERTGRLLLAFCIAYCLALVLGATPEAQRARRDLEIPRHRPRHGTCRTLSVLSLAMQMLAHPRWRRTAYRRLQRIALDLAAGRRVLKRGPPRLPELAIVAA